MDKEYMYSVCFVGEYFSLTTCVYASGKTQAIQTAGDLIADYHGFDVWGQSNEITAQCDEQPDDEVED